MSRITPPQGLTLGATVNIAPPFGGSGSLATVVIQNLSGYLLQITIGADTYWLAPFEESKYPVNLSQGGGVDVTPQLLSGTVVAATASSQVQATWYLPGESPDGTWPLSLPANALTAQTVFYEIGLSSTNANPALAGDLVPAGGTFSYDVSLYASVVVGLGVIAATAAQNMRLLWQTAIGGSTIESDNWDQSVALPTSPPPIRANVKGPVLTIANDGGASVRVFVFASNRPLPGVANLVNGGYGDVAQWDADNGGVAFIAGTTYPLGAAASTGVPDLGSLIQGPAYAEFFWAGPPRGLIQVAVNTRGGVFAMDLADSVEAAADALAGALFIRRMIALPRDNYYLQFNCTTGGIGTVALKAISAAV